MKMKSLIWLTAMEALVSTAEERGMKLSKEEAIMHTYLFLKGKYPEENWEGIMELLKAAV